MSTFEDMLIAERTRGLVQDFLAILGQFLPILLDVICNRSDHDSRTRNIAA